MSRIWAFAGRVSIDCFCVCVFFTFYNFLLKTRHLTILLNIMWQLWKSNSLLLTGFIVVVVCLVTFLFYLFIYF